MNAELQQTSADWKKLCNWLTPLRRTLLILLLLSAPLLQMVWHGEGILKYGTKIVLQPAPVDPQSLFQGQYDILSYSINRLDSSKLRNTYPPKEPAEGMNIYVRMEAQPDGQLWQLVDSGLEWPPFVESNQIVLVGQITSANSSTLRVRYGIEQFFVPEGRGHEIEQITWRNASRLKVEVFVNRVGEARIGRILVDDKPAFTPSGLN